MSYFKHPSNRSEIPVLVKILETNWLSHVVWRYEDIFCPLANIKVVVLCSWPSMQSHPIFRPLPCVNPLKNLLKVLQRNLLRVWFSSSNSAYHPLSTLLIYSNGCSHCGKRAQGLLYPRQKKNLETFERIQYCLACSGGWIISQGLIVLKLTPFLHSGGRLQYEMLDRSKIVKEVILKLWHRHHTDM